jgi:hypothetical protein
MEFTRAGKEARDMILTQLETRGLSVIYTAGVPRRIVGDNPTWHTPISTLAQKTQNVALIALNPAGRALSLEASSLEASSLEALKP